MRSYLVLVSLSIASFSLVACTGGRGSADQGGDNGDQYGNVTGESSGNTVTPDQNGSNVPNGNGNGNTSGANPAPTAPTGTPQTLSAGSYAQDCKDDNECSPIQDGNVCTTCVCSNAAIKSSEVNRYTSDKTSKLAQCTGVETNCASCQTKSAKCSGGRCTLQ